MIGKEHAAGVEKKTTEKTVTAATVAGISAAAMASLQKASVIPKTQSEMTSVSAMEEAAVTEEVPVEEKKKTPVEEIPQIHVDTAQLQERLAKSFQEVLSGFNRNKVVNAFEALGRATNSELPPEPAEEENIEEYQVTDLEPEVINEGKISADKVEAVVQKTEAPEPAAVEIEAEEKPEDKEITSVKDMDLDALFAETSGALAEAAGGTADILQETEEPVKEEIEEKQAEEFSMPDIQIIDPEEALKVDEEESSQMEAIVETEADTQMDTAEMDEAEAAMSAFESSLLESLNLELPDEEEEWNPQEINLEEQLLAALGGQDDEDAPEEELSEEQFASEIFAEESDDTETGDAEDEIPDFLPEIDMDIVMELQKEKEDTPEVPENPIDLLLAEAEEEPETPSVVLEPETPEEKRSRILNATRPERLSEHQKSLFSYFSKVPGMDEQILEAINGVYMHADEKTSRRGNIAIMGSHGTGKTRLSEGLVKAICKELGLDAVKYANLDASDMNRKDPAAVISKMAGGFLLIERASFMNAETIEKLSKAMDFRTDSMILLIEDDKANMRKLLADNPEFAEKFETVISIPVFTNDELVTFARTYAKENGYRMDEMGVLALYTLIGDNQREDEPITIGKVKDMVDGAIRKSSGIRLGKKLAKRHTDEDGRVLLYEKDFDI